jgi:DNA-damage-inducible protein D
MSIIPSGGKSPFDAIKRVRDDGSEFWRCRELMPLLSYFKWERVPAVIDRASAAAENSGHNPADHFRPSSQMVPIGSGANRELDDYELTKYGAYLVAMNGDPRKAKVAAAQTYFAVKTHEAESHPGLAEQLALAMQLIHAKDQINALTVSHADLAQRVADLEPKAEGYDDLIAAEGCFDMSAVAKILSPVTGNIGRTRLLNLLRGMGIILQGSTLPEQKYIERGYFQVRTDIVNGKAVASTVATPKGLRWLQFELREDRPTLAHAPQRNVVQLPQQGRGELA